MRYFLGLLLVCSSLALSAQVPNTADCLGAVRVCDTAQYTFPFSVGQGAVDDIVFGSTCFNDSESNSTWLKFDVDQSGFLVFEITALDSFSTDHDFIVFKRGNVPDCSSLANLSPLLRCSFAGTPGVTGLQYGATDTTAAVGGAQMLKELYVEAGNTYYILVDRYFSTGDGFTIDFSGTTASFVDDTSEVKITSIDYHPGTKTVNVTLSQPVQVSSYSNSSQHEFSIAGIGSTTINDVVFYSMFSVNGQNMSQHVALKLTQQLVTDANYVVEIDTGSDGDILLQACGTETSYDSLSFYVSATDTALVGIDEHMLQQVQVYPNPVEDLLYIKSSGQQHLVWNASLYDLNGKQIASQPVMGHSCQMDLSSVPNGTYLLICNTAKGTYKQKVVVLR